MNNKPVIKDVIQPCGCDAIMPLALVYSLYIVLHGHTTGSRQKIVRSGCCC